MPLDATNYVAVETDPVLRVLQRTEELLRTSWCQSHYAMNAAGDGVKPEDDTAVSWCWMGAAYKAAYDLNVSPTPVRLAMEQAIWPDVVSLVNDEATSVEDVLAVNRRAMDMRRAELAR